MSSLSIRNWISTHANIHGVQVGDKKQGLSPTVGKGSWFWPVVHETRGKNKATIFPNGGARSGVGRSATGFPVQGNNYTHGGGILRFAPYNIDGRGRPYPLALH